MKLIIPIIRNRAGHIIAMKKRYGWLNQWVGHIRSRTKFEMR